MRSVLISVDFIYKKDGTLHPTELNTHTKYDLSLGDLTKENFVSEVSGFFDHESLNLFMIDNNLSKITTISAGGDDTIFKVFCEYYSYDFESIMVGFGQRTVPYVEDDDSTLILRIAYDTYALIDDLYARDNYEFHNLIKNESFANPVTFVENGFDTIEVFEPSQDGIIPNYVIKSRTPGFIATYYPKGYRLENENELENLKKSLGTDEFITRFEFNSSLSLEDNRTHHLRTMSIIYGPSLDVLNLIHYKAINSVSTQNDLLVFKDEIDSNKELDKLFLSKYYPTWYSKNGLNYHSDSSDKILKPDGSLVSFVDLQIEDEIQHIFYESPINDGELQDYDQINNFILGVSTVKSKNLISGGIFVNIRAFNQKYGTFEWHDGIGNTYLIRKPKQSEKEISWLKGGDIEIGDEVLVYDRDINSTISFSVQSISFEIKEKDLYMISISPRPQFMVQLDENNSNLFLVQHNACDNRAGRCTAASPASNCSQPTCIDCGKNSPNCQNCGGASTVFCLNPV